MTTPEPLRIGLVGYGKGGRYFHAPHLTLAPDCVLAGVVTRSPQRRAELAADHPGVRVFDDLAAPASKQWRSARRSTRTSP